MLKFVRVLDNPLLERRYNTTSDVLLPSIGLEWHVITNCFKADYIFNCSDKGFKIVSNLSLNVLLYYVKFPS